MTITQGNNTTKGGGTDLAKFLIDLQADMLKANVNCQMTLDAYVDGIKASITLTTERK